MAYEVDAQDVVDLRALTGDSTLTDQRLAEIIVETWETPGTANIIPAAERAWAEIAASYAHLVDVDESGSKRALSQLRKGALEMAASYRAQLVDDDLLVNRRTTTRAIRRAQ